MEFGARDDDPVAAQRFPRSLYSDAMLAGEPFEFLANLTDMQEHEHLTARRVALTSSFDRPVVG